jgi:hypothetical protein
VHCFCKETYYKKIKDLENKTKILKNIFIRNPVSLLNSLSTETDITANFPQQNGENKIIDINKLKILKYDSKSGKCNVHASDTNTKDKV